MKGVGHGGAKDKILAVGPQHFDKCSKCGKSFQEGEAPRFKEKSLLPLHERCMSDG